MLEPTNLAGAETTPLERTIAASGLIDGLVLHRASSRVAAERPTSAGDHDRRLAERLVEAGTLNAWQVEQLKRGRTKFTLGAYRITDSIARGGMGHVFKGEHELLGRPEAIKVLPRSQASPESIASFRHEIRAQAALDHPNLVRVSYAGRDGDTEYLVTEYVPGIDLRRLVRRVGPLSETAAARVAAETAEAIQYAHKRGFVHRDIKPGNLLITPVGGVKVTDLGLAWGFGDLTGSTGVYEAGKIAGTSDYLAPEAIRNPDRVRAESDLYSLGCTLYYALSGKVPYPGGTHLDKIRRRMNEEPVELRRLAPQLSPATLRLVGELMATRPDDRPRSAGEAARRLAEIAGPGAKAELTALLTEAMADRRVTDDTVSGLLSSEAGELPETVGLPLHEIATPPLDPDEAPEISTRRLSTPAWITAAALGATFAIAVLAAWRWLVG